ncbi:MAG: glycoside hydrolase family 3 C-terminal domain-containing protein [Polyangiaceae bacterium]
MTKFRHSYSTHVAFSALAFSLACGHSQPSAGGNGGSSSTGNGGSSNPAQGGSNNPSQGGSTNGTSGSTSTSNGGSGTPGGSGSQGGSTNGTSGSTSTGNGGATDAGGTGATVTKMSCADASYSDAYMPGYTQDAAVAGQVSSAIATMSPTDKAGQMQGTASGEPPSLNWNNIFSQPNNTAQKIAGFKFRDGPRGVNMEAGSGSDKSCYSTAFPVPIARGASFDLDLELRIGQAIGDETLASGNNMMLAPAVNILRHPAWGRAQETYGEDPYLLGRMGSAFTVGVQQYVPACVKHYAANNIEASRATKISHIVDEQTFQEMYVRHFGTIIQEGGVACVMAAYNQVSVGSGTAAKCTQSKMLLTDVLRTQYGFKGFVLSDWWAMPPASETFGTAGLPNSATRAANAQGAVQAGMDMELPWNLNFTELVNNTTSGKLTVADLTTSATRILTQKFRFKVNNPDSIGGLKAPTTTLSASFSIENNAAHITLAQEAAAKSMVLLKNDANTLPIQRTVKKIAVIGAKVPYKCTNTDSRAAAGDVQFATDVRTGDLGSSRVIADPSKSTGPFAGIQAAAGSGITVVSGTSASLAADADFIVAVAGLTPEDEGEEYTGAGDRATFALDGKASTKQQDALITQLAALNKPMVVVLEGGSVIDMPWLSSVKAVVMAWYPGQVGGKALGQLLFGDVNFSGKLPITWPKSWNDEPTFSAGASTDMDYYIGYRYFDNKSIAPLFPFGHGLSYTKFEYSNLQVPCSDVTKNGVINVKVDVKNSGTVKGDEVVFLFASYPGTTVRRPAKELKAFTRVSLDPGQAKAVTIPLRVSDLKYYDQNAKAWAASTGSVQIAVGPSSANLTLKDTVTLK